MDAWQLVGYPFTRMVLCALRKEVCYGADKKRFQKKQTPGAEEEADEDSNLDSDDTIDSKTEEDSSSVSEKFREVISDNMNDPPDLEPEEGDVSHLH